MTDFYTQLEHQLVAAGHRRLGQGRAARAVAGRGRALVAATAAVAALVVAGAFALPAVFDTASTTSAPATPGRGPAPAPVAPSLAGVRVAVLNGTTARGYARSIATLLERRGARIVRVDATPAARQTRRTAVFFGRGRLAEGRARLVAQALGAQVLGPASRASSVPVAPLAGGDNVDAVVLLGIDRLRPTAARVVPAPVVPPSPKVLPPSVRLPAGPVRPLPAPAARVPSRPIPATPSRPAHAPSATVHEPDAPPAALPVPARPKTP
jgi:hypothetical protein